MCTFRCSCIKLCFLQVFRSTNYAYIGKKGVDSAVPSVFGCIPSGSRCGSDPNELVHRAGPPFLDNHYRRRGYQLSYTTSGPLE